ncbi:MAG: hypothetical protein A2284_15640 [Deltaproteobacteria bacterium RIFOXYA12_FULL_61_11]|nr:MAG: hypothetical protein A2284_15640 [Deltaproteobacteria bacterium RIFOXYA12_FULL_61_11]
MLEAIHRCERISGKRMDNRYHDLTRSSNHLWYLSNVGTFQRHYTTWLNTHSLEDLLQDLHAGAAAEGGAT